MMKANSHFGTLRYPLIMYTSLLTYVAHYLNKNRTGLNPILRGVILSFSYAVGPFDSPPPP